MYNDSVKIQVFAGEFVFLSDNDFIDTATKKIYVDSNNIDFSCKRDTTINYCYNETMDNWDKVISFENKVNFGEHPKMLLYILNNFYDKLPQNKTYTLYKWAYFDWDKTQFQQYQSKNLSKIWQLKIKNEQKFDSLSPDDLSKYKLKKINIEPFKTSLKQYHRFNQKDSSYIKKPSYYIFQFESGKKLKIKIDKKNKILFDSNSGKYYCIENI